MKLTARLAARRRDGATADDREPDPDDEALRASVARLRSHAIATEMDPFAVDPTEARVHITPDAELVIDLRPAVVVGGPAATTDMPCPNCLGALRVDGLDAVSRTATMSCTACGFTFSPRLTVPRRGVP